MKSNILIFCIFLNVALISSCNNPSPAESAVTKSPVVAQADSIKFTASMVDNKRDPSCGMPLAAGIGDTAHYKNKVLGFCSKECKDEFLKDPEKNIAAADLKK